MFVTRCVECNHEELTVNPECSCGCHAPAPQPPPDWLEKWKWAYDRIAALEAQLSAVRQANVMARDITDQANQRAENAERELAEAQERLAMAVEALRDSKCRCERALYAECAECGHGLELGVDQFDGSWICPPCNATRKPQRKVHIQCLRCKALAATAEAVAQHTATVERRGAAKELRRLLGVYASRKKLTYWALEARAAELEGA